MSQDAANLGLVRPPFVYLTAILVGVLLDLAVPLPFVPTRLATPLGASLVVLGGVLFAASVRRFKTAGTPVPGNLPTTAIVRHGPYALSRNPIYVAFSVLHLGVAIWVDSVWLVITLVAAVGAMAGVVIPREEAYLERRFGTAYLGYKNAVRRWL